MLSEEIKKLIEWNDISSHKFDCFDYAEAYELLKEESNSSIETNPKKKEIIEEFIKKAYEKIQKDDLKMRKNKINNFLERMELNKRITEQKMESLRYINSVYDSANDQLLFYPNISKKSKQLQSHNLDESLSSSSSVIKSEMKINTASRNYYKWEDGNTVKPLPEFKQLDKNDDGLACDDFNIIPSLDGDENIEEPSIAQLPNEFEYHRFAGGGVSQRNINIK